MNQDNNDYLMLSSLQHYAYCPRQFALIHIEQVWDENRFTAEGRLLHERVDSGAMEQRGDVRYERSVLLESQRYRLKGQMDLLEINQSGDARYFPVEYKRGKPKVQDWDRIQLCAQALCLEEMRAVSVKKGAIWYWQVRRREPVVFDKTLRDQTCHVIEAAHKLRSSTITPAPIRDKKRCRACSLYDLCEPNLFRKDVTREYIDQIFSA